MAVERVGNVVEYLCQECGSQGMIWADPCTSDEGEGDGPTTYAVTCPVCGRTGRAIRRSPGGLRLKTAGK